MPRPNQRRTITSEASLARRVAYERDARGLSYEALATLMTDAGCAIQPTAIFRIEKGSPPRRITVDELVALAAVFEQSIDDLLMPVDVVEQKRAKRLINEIDELGELLCETTGRMTNAYIEFFELATTNPDMTEYVQRHWLSDAPGEPGPLGVVYRDGVATDDDLVDVGEGLDTFVLTVMNAAADRVKAFGSAAGMPKIVIRLGERKPKIVIRLGERK